jgi:hypothetical protein
MNLDEVEMEESRRASQSSGSGLQSG